MILTDVASISHQNERVVDFDESLHQIALDVIEGVESAFVIYYYKITFRLTPLGISDTIVMFKLHFGTAIGHGSQCREDLLKATTYSIQSLETYLLKQDHEFQVSYGHHMAADFSLNTEEEITVE